MKILQIRFENLNSLVGEWNIDLTDPSYVSDGIFAITGPTGAGKSTILDAICLALYGRTPRLSRITKSENEIMSRHTGACFAEVTFQTRAGRYRCHWSQRRAREKPEGQLQQPKQELANADSGVVLQSKIKGVAEQIEDVTGMDFERFTRSMLLAQGDFAAFLLATADERAPILEQITGTKIYSEISILLHERQREEQGKLDVLKAKASGTVILELEQEQEIRKELEIKQKEERELIKSFGEAELAIKWLKAINSIKEEIAKLTEAEESLHKEINAFSPKRERLNRANKAAALDGQYATLKAVRKQHSDDQEELKIAEVALPKLISQANQQADILKSAEQQTRKAKTDLKAGMPQIQRVRALDQKLDELGKSISEAEADCESETSKIEENRQTRLEKQGQLKQAETKLSVINKYLEENPQDEWLVSGLTGVEEQLNTLQLRYKEIARKDEAHQRAKTLLKEAKTALEGLQKSNVTRQEELEEASKELKSEEEALRTLLGDRLLREYRTEKYNLLQKMVYLKRIVELEEHRTKLEDGKPCPLCGAKEHPFAEGNIPQPDETERKITELNTFIDKAEKQESIIRKLEKEEVKARDNLTECERQKAAAEHEKKAAETALAGLKEDLEELKDELARLKEALTTKLHPFRITDIPDSKIPLILASLRKALKEWQSHTNLKE
ncbi:MAG: AAA family ATPase, partial [Candidatus Cloacimonetes bacterium]|nr:AAA family ATPase [Candidatus Cloacimonadota bacterium]